MDCACIGFRRHILRRVTKILVFKDETQCAKILSKFYFFHCYAFRERFAIFNKNLSLLINKYNIYLIKMTGPSFVLVLLHFHTRTHLWLYFIDFIRGEFDHTTRVSGFADVVTTPKFKAKIEVGFHTNGAHLCQC